MTIELSYVDCKDLKKSARLMMQGHKERSLSESDLRYMTCVLLSLCHQNIKLTKQQLVLVDGAMGVMLNTI